MLLASFAFRAMGLLQAVIDTDEGLYLVQAQAWLRGDWPLISVWDMHPVGAPAMIALSLLAFGESVGAVRLLGILCVAATGWALFGLVRAAGGGRGLGIGAGLLYIAETTQLRGLATNTEILFAPFIAAAMAVAMGAAARTLRERRRRRPAGGSSAPPACWSARRSPSSRWWGWKGAWSSPCWPFPALWRGSLPVRAVPRHGRRLCPALRAADGALRPGLLAARRAGGVPRHPLRRAVPLFARAARPVGSVATHLHRSRHPALAGAAGRHRRGELVPAASPGAVRHRRCGTGSAAGARRAAVVRHGNACDRRAGVLLPALLPDLAAVLVGARAPWARRPWRGWRGRG